MDTIGKIDSKYRFVILAAKRAKQLLKGAKPKVKAKSRNLIQIAQQEVKSGLVDYEILPAKKDEIVEQEERVFVGEDVVDDIGDVDVGEGEKGAGAEEAGAHEEETGGEVAEGEEEIEEEIGLEGEKDDE